MTAAGLDTSGYSFPYIAGWANGDLEVLTQTAEQVTRVARQIAGHLTGPGDDRPAPGQPTPAPATRSAAIAPAGHT
jgi:hypothetical protein